MKNKCITKTCENEGRYRFTWPGRDEAAICGDCFPQLVGVADALGLHLQIRPIGDELETAIGQLALATPKGDRCLVCRATELSQAAGESTTITIKSTNGLHAEHTLCSSCGEKWIFRVAQLLGKMIYDATQQQRREGEALG